MKTILFQGDSITDASRERNRDGFNLGYGYPTLVSSYLGINHPAAYSYVNRAVSGNRIIDVYARIKQDCINLPPDFISILIGINDVWHEISTHNGIDADKFFKLYDLMLDEIAHALPNTPIMILEPFVIPGSATNEAWDTFTAETALRAKAAREVAAKHGLVFVPLQERFNEALKKAPAEFWALDGVHPNAPGHAIIAEAWLEGFRKIKL